MALSGRLLPLHLKPLPDEQLSSWLVRLTHIHGTTLYSFCWELWPQHAFWNCDIDRVFDPPTLTVLAERTATPYDRVLETTLQAFEGKLMERLSTSVSPMWLLLPGLLYRARESYGLQFCSHCLVDDAIPYLRRRWRLAFVTVCPAHHYRLLDACPHCDAPVNLRRLPLTLVWSWRCPHCRGHLAHGARSPTVADPTVAAFQDYLIEGLENGEVKVGTEMIDALTFFKGLHLLYRVCAAEAVAKSQGVTLRSLLLPKAEKNPECLRIDIRYETMRLLFEMLAAQPEQVMALCQAMRLGNEKLPTTLFQPSTWYRYLMFWYVYYSKPSIRRSH